MKKVALWIVLGALFIIPFLPLYVAQFQFFPFITGKGFWFRILVEIAAAGWLVLMLADAKFRPRFSWVIVLYGVLVVWMFIANLLGVNPHKAFWSNFERMDGWVTLIHVFGFFLVASSVLTVQSLWRKWWLTFAGASALVAGFALLQLSGMLQINQGGVRVDATFGNAAYLAAYLLFAIAVSFWQGMESKEKWLRNSLFVLGVVHVIVLFYTATRGAILGAIVGGLLGATLYAILSSGKKARTWGAAILLGILIFVGGFWMIKDSAFIQNDPTLNRLSSISLSEGSTRFAIWNLAYQGFQERPILGWGQEGFNYVFNKYYEPALYAQEVWFDRAHDVYLDWLIAGGVPALLLYLGLLMAAAWTILRSPKFSKTERVFLLSALGAYSFQAIFVFDNLFTYVPLAAIIAMAHGAKGKEIKKVDALPTVPEQQLQTVAGPLALVLVVIVIWTVNVPNMVAARHLAFASQPSENKTNIDQFKKTLEDNSFAEQEIREYLVQHAIAAESTATIPAEKKAEIIQFAIQEMTKQVDAHPNDIRFRYYLALAYRVAGNPVEALKQMDAAIAVSPKKQFLYVERGVTYLEAKNKEMALQSFKTAYELDTSNKTAAAYLAAGYLYLNNFPEAERLLIETHGTTTVDNPLIVRALYETKNFDPFIAIWKQRVVNDPKNPSARFGLASAYVVAGRVPEAIAEIRATIQAHPETAQYGAAMLKQLGTGI